MKTLSTLSIAGLLVAVLSHAVDLPAVRDGFFTTGSNIRIHYLDAGPRDDSPLLLFIPGWRLTASVWAEQIAYFSKSRRVIAIDPRSQGESSKVSDGNTPEDRARDLHELIDRLQLSRVVLVGWSQGVQDVAAYADQFGSDRVAGFVLVDSPVAAGPADIELNKEASKAELNLINLYANHPREYSEGMMASIFKKRPPKADFDRLVSDSLKTPTDTGVAMLVADLFGSDRRPSLAKFNRPTLVIAGVDSPVLAAQREMAKRLPDGRLEIVQDAGHAIFADQPDRFNQLLAKFLSDPNGPLKRSP
jgi:microsomal epoxide hydrolase